MQRRQEFRDAALVGQLVEHTSRQGGQFTAQNYLAAPEQCLVLQDLAQVLHSAGLSAVSRVQKERLPAAACLVLVSVWGAQEHVGAVI